MADVTVVRGGTIVDGTGAPGVAGDVAISDGKIVGIGSGLSGSFRLPGASHLEEGSPATAFVRPHDIRVAGEGGDVTAVIDRLASLGWLTRITLRLDSGETLVAHVPNEELHGAAEGDRIGVDLRNAKAFLAPEHEDASAPDEITVDG